MGTGGGLINKTTFKEGGGLTGRGVLNQIMMVDNWRAESITDLC